MYGPLLSLVLCATVPQVPVIEEDVTCLEINQIYSETTNERGVVSFTPSFCQIIGWDDYFCVIDWRAISKANGMNRPQQLRPGVWAAFDPHHTVMRVFRSKSFIETHTNYDRETDNRLILDQFERKRFYAPPPAIDE